MAYRNGTYVAFHADGNNIPGGKSDIDYYRMMQAWSAHPDDDFTMINSHEKASAVRDSSLKATLRTSLLKRLANSKNMVLIIGKTTIRVSIGFLLKLTMPSLFTKSPLLPRTR